MQGVGEMRGVLFEVAVHCSADPGQVSYLEEIYPGSRTYDKQLSTYLLMCHTQVAVAAISLFKDR